MNELAIRAGKIIREYRKSNGYSTITLAEHLNVSVGFLNNLETGKTDCFNLELLNNVCNTLNIPVLQLITDNCDSLDLNTIYVDKQNTKLIKDLEPVFVNFSALAFKLNYNQQKLDSIIEKLLLELNYFEKTNK